MVVLAVGAHPDDVEIGCFGTLARCVQRGDKVVVCSVSNGNLGHMEMDPKDVRLVRMAEGSKAASTIGAVFCCLDVNDMHVDSSDADQRLKLTDLMRSVKPDVVITHDRDDYHSDHIETNRLVLYCSLQANLPQVVTQAPPLHKHMAIYYMDKVGGGVFIPTEYVDVSGTWEAKLAALACHVSQVGFLLEHDGLDLMRAVTVLAEFRGLSCATAYAEAFKLCDQRPAVAMRLLP